MTPDSICCFTGHRAIPGERMRQLPQLLDQVLTDLIDRGVTVFRAGGAIGFDTLAALAVLEKRKELPQLRLELFLPCRNQTERWNERSRAYYSYVLNQADAVYYIRDQYEAGCMQERNRCLVDGSGYCVAYCTREGGGSAYTLRYAKKRGLQVINLADMLRTEEEDSI